LTKKPFTFQEFKKIYSRVPRLTAEVIILTPEGVVLAKRQEKSWHNQWHIPGGTVFHQEPLKKAVQRVAQDEIGVTVNIKKLLGYIEYPSTEKERDFDWPVGIAFLCEIKSGQLLKNERIKAFKKLPKNIISEQRKILQTVLNQSFK
jgi:ADP-ribose pyrophosphatase YjhB (NUDIX family)